MRNEMDTYVNLKYVLSSPTKLLVPIYFLSTACSKLAKFKRIWH